MYVGHVWILLSYLLFERLNYFSGIHNNSRLVVRHSKHLNFVTSTNISCVKVLAIPCLVSNGIDDMNDFPDRGLTLYFSDVSGWFRLIKTFSL